jgi:hypothetical protein
MYVAPGTVAILTALEIRHVANPDESNQLFSSWLLVCAPDAGTSHVDLII